MNQQFQSQFFRGRSGNLGRVVANVGSSFSKYHMDQKTDIVDPVISEQIIQGRDSGFDIVMAHEGEETLEPIPDRPKRLRTISSASGVSIIDSSDASNTVSAGLVKQAGRTQ
ncbi:hypothetical protein V6N13_068759 [Hibiscus sabdariffa]